MELNAYESTMKPAPNPATGIHQEFISHSSSCKHRPVKIKKAEVCFDGSREAEGTLTFGGRA